MKNRSWSFESFGDVMNLGFPIFLLGISIIAFIWLGLEIKKKRIEAKSLVSWIIWNSIFSVIMVYILIISILHLFSFDILNIFNMLSHYAFGLDLENGKQWVILVIFAFISYVLIKSLHNSIRIGKLEQRIDELNKQIAILMGQVNRTTDFENLPLATKEKSSKEIKSELREKIKIQKAQIKASEKLQLLSEKENEKTRLISQKKKNKDSE